MGRLLAGGVPVVELVGSEETVGVEGVGAGEEFWPLTYLAAAGKKWVLDGEMKTYLGVPFLLAWAPLFPTSVTQA